MNDRLIDRLFSIPGVRTVGWGFKETGGKRLDRECVIVGVVKKMPEEQLSPEDIIPKKIEDQETDVIQVGEVEALVDRKINHRPAPGGVSIGHPLITAGTLGCLVKVVGKQGWRILSNNHVLANVNAGQIGDPIYQRAVADGGKAADKIAELEAFKGIVFGGAYNFVDCAIALPPAQPDVTPNILEIGEPAGYAEAELGMEVQKSGRTTGLTRGIVQQINAVVQVMYANGEVAHFQDQIITSNMASGGDSGSAVLDMQRQLVGLLFAGSPEITIVNPFKHVVSALGLDTNREPPGELKISAFYKFSDADWVLIGQMEAAAFEYQLAWSILREGTCRLKYRAEEAGHVDEVETEDFVVDFGEPGIKMTPIYPRGGEVIETREVMLRIRVERV